MAICTVGFPFGAACSRGKAAETEQAVRDGAQEIDMVQNVGWVREARWDDVFDDVEAVVKAAGAVPVKVILETCYLTREEIAASTLVCCLAGAAFVKTSTGYGTGGTKAEDIRLMAEVAHARGVKVKASGGIRSWQTAALMIENGADRVGASGTRAIIEQFEAGSSTSSEAAAGGY
ncbi:deoxyribose-phosphate aldolase [Jaminaea rosea]|uniref:Deoxyribose-phosphate aldolase n=1 Tax=Jaminaea rosea TaxID=1569628 RepID=A0A316UIY8_9BASI|nr:deoxyribose-phosphate aldolase [Jaminaea rosea]PWN25236.1 deoxyribose-phosphate aldolase [Jaminaea rosea]